MRKRCWRDDFSELIGDFEQWPFCMQLVWKRWKWEWADRNRLFGFFLYNGIDPLMLKEFCSELFVAYKTRAIDIQIDQLHRNAPTLSTWCMVEQKWCKPTANGNARRRRAFTESIVID